MSEKPKELPRRFRPGFYAGAINLFWTVLLILLWPISVLFRRMERMRKDV